MKRKRNNQNTLSYKGYIGSVEIDLDNQIMYGKVQGLSKMLLSYEGNNIKELQADFEDSIDEYLEDCKTNHVKPIKPYSGTFNIRLTSELHKEIYLIANENGLSLNAYIRKVMQHAVDENLIVQ